MWYYLQSYIPLLVWGTVLVIIWRALVKQRMKGKKSGCSHGCSLGCFGVISILVVAVGVSSWLSKKTLYSGSDRRWYMKTYDIDGTTFYSVNVHPTDGLGEGSEPWYTCIGFQGGEAAWKKYPTELYLRQKSGALHLFDFKNETVIDLGNMPIPGPSVPVEKFFREL